MFVYSDSAKNICIKKMCCLGCRTDVLLIVINLLITVGCGLITVILESVLLKATHTFGGYNGKIKPTEAPSSQPGRVYGNVMNDYDKMTREFIIAETCIFGLTIVYVLVDAIAACFLAYYYKNMEFIKKIKQRPGPSSAEETAKTLKYQRNFHYWALAQFLLTFVALCHFIINLASGAHVSYFTIITTLFLICWKSSFLFLFAKKTVYHKSDKKDHQSANGDFDFDFEGNKKELEMKGTKSADTLSTNVSLDPHTRDNDNGNSNSMGKKCPFYSVSTSGSASKNSSQTRKAPVPPVPPTPPGKTATGSVPGTFTNAASIPTAAASPA